MNRRDALQRMMTVTGSVLIGAEFLARMQHGSFIVNSGSAKIIFASNLGENRIFF